MTTDRTYLMAGSIAPRLNNALPHSTTVLETDLDTDRDMVHVRVVVSRNGVVSIGASGSELYFGITDTSITSTVEHDGFTSPRKVFTVTEYMSDSTWSQTVCDYITAEVNHFIACNAPRMTGSDYVRSQVESEQGWTLA
jgi:hypothetical protein